MIDLNSSIHTFYESNDEYLRLKRTRVNNIELLTTLRYLEKICTTKSKILDACAGTGVYAFYLANKGYDVTAGDLVECNVEHMKKQQLDNPVLSSIYSGSITDLSRFPDESFDVVLNLGAFYHMTKESDRDDSIKESLRVLKPGGVYFLAYINKFANLIKNRDKMKDNLDSFAEYLKSGYNSENSLFYASTPEDVEESMKRYHLVQLHNIATDGMKFIIRDTINSFSDDDFNKWMEIHFQSCETKSTLGYSEHGLYIGKK